MVVTSDATEVARASDPSPFHLGEQRVQTMVGSRALGEKLGRTWHRQQLSPSSAQFFAKQQLLYTATRSSDERLWASVLIGPPGFASSSDGLSLTVEPLRQFKGDAAEFKDGDHIGLTGIILETRQRERLNGKIRRLYERGLEIRVVQSFGTCPKYIQARKVEVRNDELQKVGTAGEVVEGSEELGNSQRQMIERSDTMFLATCYFGDLEANDGEQGTDVSHRGGPPGFAKVSGAGTVCFADYVGNYTFTTLGNLVLEPRASLLLVDYATGDVLQLSGKCQILWEERKLPGAQRTMQFVTERWVHSRGALPLQTPGDVQWSPYNPLPTCQYSAEDGKERIQQLFTNYVDSSAPYAFVRCLATIKEADEVMTFEFEAKDKRKVEKFCEPGQYASFDFPGIQEGETLNRTWTISSPQAQISARGTFTITVKRVGIASGWLFDNMKPGRTICLRGVEGAFTLDRAGPRPPAGYLLVAGGIGITPLRVMFHQCVEEGVPVTLLYAVRRPEDAVFLEDLQKVAQNADKAMVSLTVTGSRTVNICADSQPQTLRGRVTALMLQQVCGDVKERIVLQCGPPAMMSSIADELSSLGYPLENLHQEEFFF